MVFDNGASIKRDEMRGKYTEVEATKSTIDFQTTYLDDDETCS